MGSFSAQCLSRDQRKINPIFNDDFNKLKLELGRESNELKRSDSIGNVYELRHIFYELRHVIALLNTNNKLDQLIEIYELYLEQLVSNNRNANQ